jgi:hypothetical protein
MPRLALYFMTPAGGPLFPSRSTKKGGPGFASSAKGGDTHDNTSIQDNTDCPYLI